MKNKAKNAQQMNLISKTYALKEQIYREKGLLAMQITPDLLLKEGCFQTTGLSGFSWVSICFR